MLSNHTFRPGVCIECGRRLEDPIHEEVCDDALAEAYEASYIELGASWDMP